jgi:hypothetical protein
MSTTDRRTENEDFGLVERRLKAMAYLDSPELLMMYAQTTGDVSRGLFFSSRHASSPSLGSTANSYVPSPHPQKSIPGARLHFMKMLCGYDDDTKREDRKRVLLQDRDVDKRRGGDRAAMR